MWHCFQGFSRAMQNSSKHSHMVTHIPLLSGLVFGLLAAAGVWVRHAGTPGKARSWMVAYWSDVLLACCCRHMDTPATTLLLTRLTGLWQLVSVLLSVTSVTLVSSHSDNEVSKGLALCFYWTSGFRGCCRNKRIAAQLAVMMVAM